jgi:bile acid:Na+ symporter, BASS family
MITILLLPLLIGMFIAEKFTVIAQKIAAPLRWLSIIILGVFILIAIKNNAGVFAAEFSNVFWLVLIHNGLALTCAYYFSSLLRNDEAANRTIAIETGIQNSGLGLILIFTFFNGHAEMALVAAWWGVWHLISGFAFASFMRWKGLTPKHA